MTVRGIIWAVLLCLAGVLSAGVTLYGIRAAINVDLRQDTLLSSLYGGLPLLCFPVFLLVRPRHRSAVVLSLMALTYLGAYSALNWRSCSELGYCDSITATVMQTLSTNMVLAFFAVVVLSLLALLVDDHSSLWRAGR
ncbi:MAG: hypothetical protein WBX19_15005 [Terracidiphilus sp.]